MAYVSKVPEKMETTSYAESPEEIFGELTPFAEPSWYVGYASPYYKESHRRLRKAVRQYMDEQIMDNLTEWDEAKITPPHIYKNLGDAGFHLASIYPLPEKEIFDSIGIELPGGIPYEEWDAFHDFVFNDEVSRCASIGFTMAMFAANQIGLPPVLKFASSKLKKEIIGPVLKGDKRICLAITEPDAGSDVSGLSTTAKLSSDGKHYIVNGEKKWITTGLWSDYLTTAVRTGGPGPSGISVLLIPAQSEGLTMRRMHTGGARSSGSTFVSFDDVQVPAENLLGREGAGFKVIMENFNHERLIICFLANRFARVCLEDTLKHVRQRQAFGASLYDLGTIRAKLSEMARRIEAQHSFIESLVYQGQILPKKVQDARLGGLTALGKANGTACLEFCANEAVNCFGGLGCTVGGRGERVERLFRDQKIISIPGGAYDVMNDLAIRQQVKVMEALAKQSKL